MLHYVLVVLFFIILVPCQVSMWKAGIVKKRFTMICQSNLLSCGFHPKLTTRNTATSKFMSLSFLSRSISRNVTQLPKALQNGVAPVVDKTTIAMEYPDSVEVSKVTKQEHSISAFQRIVHVSQIPRRRGIVCRMAAKDEELLSIARQCGFVYPLTMFQANVTLSWKDESKILIEGKFIGQPELSVGGLIARGKFDTLLLCNYENPTPLKFSKSPDCDDEVDKSGNIDVGQIAVQYFDLQFSLAR